MSLIYRLLLALAVWALVLFVRGFVGAFAREFAAARRARVSPRCLT